ncbi:MAG: TonB-dependent receptor [Chitinophagaceae bacterium]
MKQLFLLTLSAFLFVAFTQAQQVAGSVKDEQGKALSGATASLKKTKDSSIVKLGVTDNDGKYSFSGIANGKYFVSVSFTSHQPANSAVFEVSGTGVEVPGIILTKATGNLKEVVVTTRKPIVEVRADKMVLNVEGTINAVGQDALELLRKSPGVLVDKDDNLSLSGKNGVTVYIDGRPTPLAGKDLADYLKTIQSSNVESIEIITNPSAKYDAAGNAGIINIKLKKNKSFGTNGSVTAGYNIGVYSKYNGGLSLNHRNKKVNLFGNYNYNNSINESNMKLYREQLDTLFDQKGVVKAKSEGHTFKAGADYFLNKRSTVGVMVNGSFSDNEIDNYSRTPISYIPTGIVNRILVADNTSDQNRKNVNANVNYRYADTSGHELNVDGDYGWFRIRNNQLQPNYYYNPSNGNEIDRKVYNMVAPTDINMYSVKADYEQNFKKGRLGIGGKTYFVNSVNDFQRYDVLTSGKQLDTLRSNKFDYKENINAVYVNYNRAFKGFMIQAGLRVENTNTKGISNGFRYVSGLYTPYDSTFTRHYTDFFPSAAITFNKKPTNQWSITYSRRIDRPAYQNLNPFEFKLDEYTFQKGNTQLRPQYTNSIGVSNTYKYRLTTTLNYSHVKDVFTQLVDTAEKSKAFLTQKNLATQDIISLNISYPFQYKWYSIFGNVNSYYSHYKADFGAADRKVDVNVFAVQVYAQQSARLGKGWTAEMTGFYTSPSIWQGTFKSKALWSIDGGVQKTIFKGKGTVKGSVSDIFRTLKWKGTSNFSGQTLVASGNFESRQLKLNFTYRFGNNQVKAARQRKTGVDDESKRVGAQGGGIGNQ